MSEFDPNYIMGRSTAETRRLQLQAALYDPSTLQLFRDAGIAEGMKVLDIGCGAGDVSFLAAQLVGPSGQVVGIDANPVILEEAAVRAHSRQLRVTFRTGDVGAMAIEGGFDAIIGRLVLIYLPRPANTLKRLVSCLKPGGIVAFQEIDWGEGPIAMPPSPLLAATWEIVREMFQRAGLNNRMGLSLASVFVGAGLEHPHMSLFAPVGGGADFDGYDYMTSGLRSNLPHIVKLGVATEEQMDLDTFAERLRAEMLASQGVFALPTFAGAWARTATG